MKPVKLSVPVEEVNGLFTKYAAIYSCPVCNSMIPNHKAYSVCAECGAVLDWDEEQDRGRCDMGPELKDIATSTVRYAESWIVKNPDNKPPVGVKPARLVAESRILELADAIKRQLESEKPHTGMMEQWAQEMLDQIHIANKYPFIKDSVVK